MAKPKLISMKGLPCTGKTTLAKKLAVENDCLLVELDDILYPIADGSRNTLKDEVINEISYQVARNMVAKHLKMAHNVLLDCPLSHQSHFDLLRQVAVHANAELVIVECRPQDFKWKEWINQRQGTSSSSGAQFKTETWEEIKKLKGERYGDYETGNIRKVIVDTTMPSLKAFDELLSSTLPSRGKNSRRSPRSRSPSHKIKKGVRIIDSRSNRDSARRSNRDGDRRTKSGPRQVGALNHHHVLNIVNQPSQETDKRASCSGCRKSIPGDSAFYRCNQCRFQLHKSCAEAPANLERQLDEKLPFLDPETNDYRFPKKYWCGSSECEEKQFSKDCLGCLFKTQLRCGFLPPVVPNHPCHPKHPLLLHIFRSRDNKDFKCRACSERGDSVFYKCKACDIYLHVNCTLLPRIVNSKCHMDTLSLLESSPTDDPDAYDEIYCDACEKERNPNNWIYYCEGCNFATHLDCAFTYTD
ncbi:uncharacterized protein LOC120000301 [Tripterygium wilfordii]|uniref:uncharacterized protein LOC120000301 n=1 Tax=Tripterygium wilfordii TaxID=458696 RepID=UPI0018F7F9AD|nr:uncharacterized protein LOC120000301 [Tripterygium wilfordii]